MGKTCNTILGLGLAGAIIGMYVYMFRAPDDQCEIKEEFKGAVDDLKKATNKLMELGG